MVRPDGHGVWIDGGRRGAVLARRSTSAPKLCPGSSASSPATPRSPPPRAYPVLFWLPTAAREANLHAHLTRAGVPDGVTVATAAADHAAGAGGPAGPVWRVAGRPGRVAWPSSPRSGRCAYGTGDRRGRSAGSCCCWWSSSPPGPGSCRRAVRRRRRAYACTATVTTPGATPAGLTAEQAGNAAVIVGVGSTRWACRRAGG